MDSDTNKPRRRSLSYRRYGVRKGLDASVRDGFVIIDYRDPDTLWLTIRPGPQDSNITLEVTRFEVEQLLEGFDQ